MRTDTRGIPNLVARKHRRKSSFWQPIFSWINSSPLGRSFKIIPAGHQAAGPVNLARSYGGVTVTPELALTLSAVWACTWRYANTISTLPLQVMRVVGGANHASVYGEHPLYRVLHDQPNTKMSAATYWQSQVARSLTWGVSYARKLYGSQKQIVGLDPWDPQYVTAYLDQHDRLRYAYQPGLMTLPNGNFGPQDVAAEELFVVLDRSLDGLTGLSRIQYGANSMGAALSAERAAQLAWKNGFRASGILHIAQWLTDKQRDEYRKIVNNFVGSGGDVADENSQQFGVMVAENATKFEALTLKPADLELLSSRQFSVEDVCRWYDVPPILIGHSSEGQTMWGSGVEQLILGWQKLGLAPVLRKHEQEVWRQLIAPAEQETVFAEFNLDALLRGDSTSRATFYSQMSQNGVYTRNEIRARENLPPAEGGDKLTVQSNLVPLAALGEGTAPLNDAQQLHAALSAFLQLEKEAGTAPPPPQLQ